MAPRDKIKLDGFRMAARIERGQARLFTRTGLDWSEKYPVLMALGAVRAKTAYLDGELCGVGVDAARATITQFLAELSVDGGQEEEVFDVAV
jgi:ATP-dependent DNA ligase